MPERSGYAVGQARGDFAFCHNRPVFHARRIHQVDRVAVTAKRTAAGRDIVCQDPVAAFAQALLAGILDDVLGLRSKADDEAGTIAAAPGDRRENVGVLGQAQARGAAGLRQRVS